MHRASNVRLPLEDVMACGVLLHKRRFAEMGVSHSLNKKQEGRNTEEEVRLPVELRAIAYELDLR
jgi:hypothetical protein